MVEEVETEESGLKAFVQHKYVNLSPRISRLSAALAQPGSPGLTYANMQVHGQLVELMVAAFPNPEFRRLTAKVYHKYATGEQVTGKKYRGMFDHTSPTEKSRRAAKDTLYVWNVVTDALIRAKLLVLKD